MAESVPAAWALLTEPLSSVLQAIDRLGPVVGADALVIGAGPAGWLHTRMLSRAGERVDVVEPKLERRRAAPVFRADRATGAAAELERSQGWGR